MDRRPVPTLVSVNIAMPRDAVVLDL